jgi:predicted secreted acid phosphatase
MGRCRNKWTGLVALACGMLATLAFGAPPEPRNISLLKADIRAYVASGDYARGVEEVAAQAETWIEARVRREHEAPPAEAPTPKLAVIFDLDETLIDNVGHVLEEDFGYVPGVWADWVERAEAPAIEPVRRVYATAHRLGVAVVFLSGRRERDRAATERNLRAIGCVDCARLILKPNDRKGPNGEFKRSERKRLAAEGFVVVANLGDQASDFDGGGAEKNFKLPNPFYLTE